MNILFVCRHNRFRSKVAEAFFNKINKNPEHKAKSAGIIKGVPVADSVKKIGRENGVIIESETNCLTEELVNWADSLIIVANDVPIKIFSRYKKSGKKVILWNIKDVSQNDENSIRRVFLQIKKKTDAFQRGLK